MIVKGKYYMITNVSHPEFKIISKCINYPDNVHGHGFVNIAVLSTDLTFNGPKWNAHKINESFKITFDNRPFYKDFRYKEIDIEKHPEYFL